MEQLTLPGFIERKTENQIISQRVTDGYVNATAMCKAAGKQMKHYNELLTTKAFILELSSVVGIPPNGLIQSYQGGIPHLQGTWVHPQVAVHLAQWLSPKFAVLVSQWVAEWMSGGARSPNLPYHLRRYMANAHHVPYGYFSMLNEVTLHLIGPLEQLGYTVSSSQLPDGSLGKTFSKHLRCDSFLSEKDRHKVRKQRIERSRLKLWRTDNSKG
ncbi:MAG: KilA-N domain-containing protein, partial [Defluviitaleaceae bacterium]|nr:KilA-N domain-containing protein [Defluviitaleaceae bacterium]